MFQMLTQINIWVNIWMEYILSYSVIILTYNFAICPVAKRLARVNLKFDHVEYILAYVESILSKS